MGVPSRVLATDMDLRDAIQRIALEWPSYFPSQNDPYRTRSGTLPGWVSSSAGDLPPSLPQERDGTAALLTHG